MSLGYPDTVVQLFVSSQHNQFHIKITFAMSVSKAQVQTFNQAAIYLPSPVFPAASCMWHFADCVRLTALLLESLKDIDSLHRMTSHTAYREVLQRFNYIHKYMSNKYLIFSTCQLLAPLQVFIFITLLATLMLFMSVH